MASTADARSAAAASSPLFVVGAGRVGATLAGALHRAGVPVIGCWTRSRARAEAVAGLVPPPLHWGPLPATVADARTVLLAVTDDALEPTVGALLDGGLLRNASVVLHCGGARCATEALANLAGSSCARGTLHPLAAMARAGQLDLSRVSFAVEGEPRACEVAQGLVAALGASWFNVPAQAMALYHAAAVVASNHTVALWAEAVQMLERAGLEPAGAVEALLGLLRSTLDNARLLGLPHGLTGPVRRGDVGTVRRHLQTLTASCPEALAGYLCGARAALVQARRLAQPEQQPALDAIEQLLQQRTWTAPHGQG